ncbi:shikimate kinase [Gordonia sp. DT30]|uniref:shikimate kinase n=1 Tax=unclassified Gordonia (in: high G+C Gram-positive bacteria) TaxID=2657482 RepID=UPI003CF67F9F
MTGAQPPVTGGPQRPVAVLVGFMGAGKSTVGRVLADQLGVDLVDTDCEIVQRTGQAIPEIFADAGAERFRQIESEVVLDVLERHRGVVALGGGAVTTEAVRDALGGHRVVHLKVDADAGFARVSGSDRPLLAGADPAERYRLLLAERAGTYAEVATIEVDAARGDAHDVADTIIAAIARELVPERTP